MLGGTYSTGTVAITTGSATVTSIGALWNDVLEGDELWPTGAGPMLIGADVVSPWNTLTLMKPWPGATLTASTYVIVKVSWKRHDVTELQKLWRTLAAELEATGNFIFVEGDEPDPEMGENGQFALKTNVAPWKLWLKDANVWVLQGIPVGSIWRGAWNSATTYQINDVVARNGGSYISKTVNTNQPPESNPDDWDLASAPGSTGADGGVITIPYTFSTTTSMADPGSGFVRLNNATQNTATALAVDLIDNRSIDFSMVLANAFGTTNPVKGHIRIHKANDTTRFLTLAVSAETAPPGFRQYTVSVIGASHASPFADLDAVLLNYSRAGDLGAQGLQGIQGIQGSTGNAGGFAALPYIVDALSVADADPGQGKMRFGAVPQSASAVLRFNNFTSAIAPVGGLLSFINSASSSASKVGGRLFVNGSSVPVMHFTVTAAVNMGTYHNLDVAITSASSPDPFPDGASVIFDFLPVGEKGDAATIQVGLTTTADPGEPANVVNIGNEHAAVFNFTIPQGEPGEPFSPTYVVPDIAGRAAYDAFNAINPDGTRLSVLVESDSTHSGLPTLYFKQSDAAGDWSDGITFATAAAGSGISYDNSESGLGASNVQDAIDELAGNIDDIPNPIAMAIALGGA